MSGVGEGSTSETSAVSSADAPVDTDTHSARGDNARTSVEPGQVLLGKYRIVRKLGAGGMAEVYEATHLQLGSRLALKLPLGRHATPKGGARLLREAQVAASLDPDRVVRVFDVGTLEGGTPFMVLEYLEGQTLAALVAERERLPLDIAIAFTVEACLGLVEAHRRGIVHRDIKPSNLFIEQRRDGSQRLKILDFGIASIRAAAVAHEEPCTLTDSSAAIGSPPYMAPEQVRGADDVDARCDVWALGVTLYQLLSGALPFHGTGPALIASIVTDLPPPLGKVGVDVPPELEALIQRCLSKDPSQRPATAADLAQELDRFVAGKEGPIAAPRRPRSFAVIALGSVLLAVAVGVVVHFSNRRETGEGPTTSPAGTAVAYEEPEAAGIDRSPPAETTSMTQPPMASPTPTGEPEAPAPATAPPGRTASPAVAGPSPAATSNPIPPQGRSGPSRVVPEPVPSQRSLLDEREFAPR